MKTKKDIVACVATEAGLDRRTVSEVTERVVSAIAGFITQGEDVRIAGLGTFRKSHVDEREARNPRTGETLTVPAHETVRFKPSAGLMERINP